MDPQILYRQGVIAIRDDGDHARGRELLIASLKLAPQNDMAWLWLSRTVSDSQQKLKYVERALQINPDNVPAQQLKSHLRPQSSARAVVSTARKTVDEPVTQAERERIAQFMEQAAIHMEAGEVEDAIAQWVHVLAVRVDHETALRNAAGHLWRLGYQDDAVELVQRALDAGTLLPAIFLTAIDMAERQNRYDDAEALRNRIAQLSDVDAGAVITIADGYVANYRVDEAFTVLTQALEHHPNDQHLLLRLGDLSRDFNRRQDAMMYYDRAVRAGATTALGKDADARLAAFPPVLTDRERGSVPLALREAVGIAVFFLLLGWQDAGLDLFAMGWQRWAGVAISVLGGYLLVTATSSPQQRPVAEWLGGDVPPAPDKPQSLDLLEAQHAQTAPGQALQETSTIPLLDEEIRYALGTAGVMLLALAFYMVFSTSIELVINTPPPYWLW